MIIRIEIPGRPTGKGRARATRQGRMYTPEKTRTAEGYVQHMAALAMQGHARFEDAVSMGIDIAVAPPQSWSKKRRDEALCGRIRPTTKPDCDNIVKLLADAFNGIVWRDDVQVVDLLVKKRYAEHEATAVTVMNAGAA